MKYITIPESDYNAMEVRLRDCEKLIDSKTITILFHIHSLPFYSSGMDIHRYAKLSVDDRDLDFTSRGAFNDIVLIIKAEIDKAKEERAALEKLKAEQKRVPGWILKLFNL